MIAARYIKTPSGQDLNRPWWHIDKHLYEQDHQILMNDVNLESLAKTEGELLYVCHLDRVQQNYRMLKLAFKKHAPSDVNTKVYYAMKANGATQVMNALKKEDVCVDTSSIGEVKRCLELGIDPSKLIFTGTNFGLKGYEFLARSGALFNVDSMSQIERIKDFAPINISIRFNPGIGGVGFNNKFEMSGTTIKGSRLGIFEDQLEEAVEKATNYGLKVVGLHQHVGSNWLKLEQLPNYMKAVEKLTGAYAKLQANGYPLELLNLGGGIGVRSHEKYSEFPLDEFFQGIWQIIKKADIKCKEVAIEPGRAVVGDSTVMLTTVNSVERKNGINYAGVNAGFNVFHHKFLYDVDNTIVNISKLENTPNTPYAVVGYLGETGDIFEENLLMPKTEEGDIILFYPAGAYCQSEVAVHHFLPTPKEIFV